MSVVRRRSSARLTYSGNVGSPGCVFLVFVGNRRLGICAFLREIRHPSHVMQQVFVGIVGVVWRHELYLSLQVMHGQFCQEGVTVSTDLYERLYQNFCRRLKEGDTYMHQINPTIRLWNVNILGISNDQFLFWYIPEPFGNFKTCSYASAR
jgi:hypothetical protein